MKGCAEQTRSDQCTPSCRAALPCSILAGCGACAERCSRATLALPSSHNNSAPRRSQQLRKAFLPQARHSWCLTQQPVPAPPQLHHMGAQSNAERGQAHSTPFSMEQRAAKALLLLEQKEGRQQSLSLREHGITPVLLVWGSFPSQSSAVYHKQTNTVTWSPVCTLCPQLVSNGRINRRSAPL